MSKSHGYDFRNMTLAQLSGLGLRVKGENLDARRDVAIEQAKVFTPEAAKAAKKSKPRPKAKLLSIAVFLPMRIHSEANEHQHWSKKAARATNQADEFAAEWYRLTRNAKIELPCEVRLTRIGQKALDDDNLANGFKKLRDAIAAALEVDDGSDQIKFTYGQQATGKRQYGVKIEVISL